MAMTEMNYGESGGDKTYIAQLSAFPTNGKITTGFKPKYAAVMSSKYGTTNSALAHIFDRDSSATTYITLFGGQTYTTNIGATGSSGFISVDEQDGFIINSSFASNWTTPIYIVAIG